MLGKAKEQIYPSMLAITIFVGLFSIRAVPIMIVTLVIVWLCQERDFSNVKARLKYMWPYFIYCLVFCVGLIYADDKKEAVKSLEKLTSFLLFPFLIICCKWNVDKGKTFSRTFLIGVFAICFWSIARLFFFMYTEQEFLAKMDSGYLQWKLPHLIGYHPTYMGMLIVTATIILLQKHNTLFKSKWRYNKMVLVIFLTLFLIYLSPRTAIFLQCMVIVCNLLQDNEFNLVKLKRNVGIILLALIGIVFFVSKSSFLMDKMERMYTDNRFFLWPYAFEVIEDNFYILGEGLGGGQKILDQTLEEVNDPRKTYHGSDLHNQYLKNYMDLGFFGFISLLLIVIWPIGHLKDPVLTLFMIIFAIAMITESMLSLIKGIVFFNVISLTFIHDSLFKKADI